MNKMRVFIWLIALIGFSACQSKSGQTTEQENVDSLTVAPTEEEKTITGVVGDASMHNFMLVTLEGESLFVSTMDQEPSEIGGFELGDTVQVNYIEEEEEPGSNTIPTAKKVIVVGSGPVGLSFVKLGKLFGLGQIDIVDMLPAKLEVARRMGADNGYTPAEISTPEFIAAANRSYDAVIDAVGLDVVVNSVLPLVKMGGDVCVYGVMTKNPTFDLSKAPYNFDLHMHQWPTRSEEKAAMTTLAQWIEEGTLSASDFITHRFKIEEIEEAFAAVKRGEVLKCVLTF